MHATGVKTEHLVARIFFSVSRTLDHHTHMRVAQDLTGLMFGMCCTFAHLKSRPLATCFIDHSFSCLTHFHHFVLRRLLKRRQHCPGLESRDLPAPLRTEDYSLAIWPKPLPIMNSTLTLTSKSPRGAKFGDMPVHPSPYPWISSSLSPSSS